MSEMFFADSAEGFTSFDIAVKDLSLSLWLFPERAISEIKEDLYYAVYACYKQVHLYLEQRPDFCYALDPITPLGEEPPLIQEMMKASMSFGTPPMAGYCGVFADWALSFLRHYGKDIFVKCNHAIAADFLKGRRFLIPYPMKMPLGSFGIAAMENTVVLGKNAGFAEAAASYLQNELKRGEEMDNLVAEIKPVLGIMGGVLFLDDKEEAWGIYNQGKRNRHGR